MSDESGDISGITVASLKERLTEILEGFNKKDVYNLDETGCFWRALPQLDLWRKAKSVKEVKKVSNASQLRLWLNAVGEKEQPIVIWKVQILDASEDLINANYLLSITVKTRHRCLVKSSILI